MRVSFRQGIVLHQTDISNNPVFLQKSGNFVNLIVSPDPTILNFADGTKNYLYTESLTVNQAWGPFADSLTRWIYWDINRTTGVRSFGATTLAPVLSAVSPTSPAVGQMWWNTTTFVWSEWNGSRWVPVIRVFAAKYINSATFQSVSVNTPLFTGTQVGLATVVNVGALAFDDAGKPIRTSDNKFFTTEDPFTTGISTGALIKVASTLITATAKANLSAYQVAQFNNFNEVIAASPFDQYSAVYGIIEESASINETVRVITDGTIFNAAWDWSAQGLSVNDFLYIDSAGTIVKNNSIPSQIPVGVVLGKQEILFRPGIFGTIPSTSGATTLDGLTDVNVPSPTNNYVLTFDSGTGQWVAAASTGVGSPVSSGATSLDELTDVTVGSPANDDVLSFDSVTGQWVSRSLSTGGATTLDQLTDVNAPSPNDGDSLVFDSSSGNWLSFTPAIDDLSDVNAPSPTDNQVLTFDSGTSQWIAQTSTSGGATTLDGLTDVTVGSPIDDGIFLVFDSTTSQWVPSTNYNTGFIKENSSVFVYSASSFDNTLRKISSGGSEIFSLSLGAQEVKVDINGFIYTTGSTTKKLNPDGTEIWSNFAGGGFNQAIDIDDNGNVYVGTNGADVIKYNSSGNTQWSFTGFSTDNVTDVAVDSDGSFVYAVAGFNGTVRKLSGSTGNQVWSFSGFGASFVYGVAVDLNGFVYAGASDNTIRKLDSNGNQLWSFTATGEVLSVAVDNNGFIYFTTNGTNEVVKLDDTGSPSPTLVWTFSGHTAQVNDVAVDEDGNVYSVSHDFTVRKISASGSQIWSFTGHTSAVSGVAVQSLVDGVLGTLDDLSDVSVNSANNGDVLTFNSSSSTWENSSIPTSVLDDLTDVTIGSPVDNQVLTFDSVTGQWIPQTPIDTGATTLDALTDVNVPSPVDNQVLTFDSGTSQWIAATPAGVGSPVITGATTLDELTDVTIGSPADNSLLAYDSVTGQWINQTASESGVLQPGDNVSSLTNDAGYLTNINSEVLNDLSDVTVGSPANDDVLSFDSVTGQWVSRTLSTGGATTLDGLNDVTIGSPADNDVLTFDSVTGQWVPAFNGSGDFKSDGSVSMTGDLNMGGNELVHYAEAENSPTITAGAITLNLAIGNIYNVTLTENITSITFSNVPTQGGANLVLVLTQDGGSPFVAKTVTWPASVKWAGGTAPTLSNTAGAIDVITMFTTDAGTTWLAFTGGLDLS